MQNRLFRIFAILGIALLPLLAGQAQDAAAQDSSYYREISFATASVITIDGQSPVVLGLSPASLAAFQLNCTEDSGTATLDVTMQRSFDSGATWGTLVAFTQLSATGAETKFYADVHAASAQMIGDRLRADFNITGTGQYTCTLTSAFEG